MSLKNVTKVTAITGGIGSGKSVVSRVLRTMGFDVYDCDREAKAIMDSDSELHRQLQQNFGESIVRSGIIDRKKLASIVFNNDSALTRLNSIVHGKVRQHFAKWCEAHRGRHVFVETAILYQSGIDEMVDNVWIVDAPREIRLLRAMGRDNSSEEAILKRIEAQDSFIPAKRHSNETVIINDGNLPVIPRLLSLL